jgi:hypothetical protein
MNDNEELRCYTFTLAQLNTMQQGIQAAHAAIELGMKAYRRQMRENNLADFRLYHEWATEWKTLIMLNGGDATELQLLEDFLYDTGNTLPWAAFYEDGSFYNALTSVAIIIPARIFISAEELRKGNPVMSLDYPDSYSDWELELINRLSNARRAV